MKRVITAEIKILSHHANLMIVEACDGIECLVALYLAYVNKITIDAIISDETMPFVSGSYASKIIDHIISEGKIEEVKMFVASALNHPGLKDNYSKVVKKIYAKPIDRKSIKDLLGFLNVYKCMIKLVSMV